MNVSIFDLYSIGIGPSSSHTVGPMRAAYRFVKTYLKQYEKVVTRVHIDLYGSLALTGKGHSTDTACLLGLSGQLPERVDPAEVVPLVQKTTKEKKIALFGEKIIPFDVAQDIEFHYHEELPYHANGLRLSFYNAEECLCQEDYYSVGGGFILSGGEISQGEKDEINSAVSVPFPFDKWSELESHCKTSGMNISEVMMVNESKALEETLVKSKVLEIWQVMDHSISEGLDNDGVLPGALKVPRRAHKLCQKLEQAGVSASDLNWLNAYAIAVNEENAAGGRVVTAPTNGAAGIIPAVLKYYLSTAPRAKDSHVIDYLLVTAAIGILFKKGASISAAEVGCQGEVGVACSMAAAGLCALFGGTIEQIGNAAEMGMEHNLGLTCDPIGGLVQIPCIERNAMGAVQAVNAAKLALLGDGKHQISLDTVIATMKQTGADMSKKYKETALGGLAVNLPAC